jgi:hypothetical protein
LGLDVTSHSKATGGATDKGGVIDDPVSANATTGR